MAMDAALTRVLAGEPGTRVADAAELAILRRLTAAFLAGLVVLPAGLSVLIGAAAGLPIGVSLAVSLYLISAVALVAGSRFGAGIPARQEGPAADLVVDPWDYCPGLFLTLDTAGIVRGAGGRDREMFLSFLREPLSRPFVEQVHVSDRIAFARALDELRLGADVVVIDLRLDRPVLGLDQAQFLNVRLDMTALRDATGQLAGVRAQMLDIEGEMQMREAVSRKEHEAHAAHELKSRFLAAVSHELRTPITSIVGFAEELDETADPSQRQATEIIVRNANRLTEMVEELLELGRMTAPNPVRERGIHDLSQLAREAIADQAATARDRGIVVEERLCDRVTPVEGSTGSLMRIISNLVANALKFTPDGGVVRVTTACDDQAVTLTVDDSGPGISDADAPHVFDRFFRSSDPVKRQTPGTGLGLSITRSLVELLDGTIAIERSDLGGARLVVRLPRAAVEGAPDAEAEKSPEVAAP